MGTWRLLAGGPPARGALFRGRAVSALRDQRGRSQAEKSVCSGDVSRRAAHSRCFVHAWERADDLGNAKPGLGCGGAAGREPGRVVGGGPRGSGRRAARRPEAETAGPDAAARSSLATQCPGSHGVLDVPSAAKGCGFYRGHSGGGRLAVPLWVSKATQCVRLYRQAREHTLLRAESAAARDQSLTARGAVLGATWEAARLYTLGLCSVRCPGRAETARGHTPKVVFGVNTNASQGEKSSWFCLGV